MHIVTDNGSNYKKACKALGEVYEHILWTPCLAHTVNLMLKDIAAVLNPRYSYTMEPTQEMFRGLKDTFERMTDVQSAVQALQELEVFRQKVGEFGSEMAMRMAMDPKTSPCKSYSVTYCCFLYI